MIYVTVVQTHKIPALKVGPDWPVFGRMVSDNTIQELDDFAAKVGVSRDCFECYGGLLIYKITAEQRAHAIELGACAIGLSKELFEKCGGITAEQVSNNIKYLMDRSNGIHGKWYPRKSIKYDLMKLHRPRPIQRPVSLDEARQPTAAARRQSESRLKSSNQVPYQLEYADNPYILKWWSDEHDQMLREKISTQQSSWHNKIFNDIVTITHDDVLEQWRRDDPLCHKYAWYNILRNFAGARAEVMRFTSTMQAPKVRVCPLCDHEFVEDSVRFTYVERLGVEQIDFCEVCLDECLFRRRRSLNQSADSISNYLRSLANALGRVPHADFGDGLADLWGLTTDQRCIVLKLLKGRPVISEVKEHFGSWLNALVQAKVLEDGVLRTSRGTRCLAEDGHACLSLAEKTIDDFLYRSGIAHIKEPAYPEGSYRADFACGDYLIEYFGLAGNAEYDEKTSLKQEILRKHNVPLISLFPCDVLDANLLKQKLSAVMKDVELNP